MMKVCAEMAEPFDRLNMGDLEPERVLPSFGAEWLKISLSPLTLSVHRLLTTEGARFPKVAQTMLANSYLKTIGLLASWVESQQSKPHAKLSSDVPARALAEQFVSMVSSDVKLRAIVGLVQTPLSEEAIDEIVSRAVRTFLHGASTSKNAGPRRLD
ncbi:hypothetical protein SM14VA4_49280 (plasmid) [Serratia marcescens]|nr:hypothetical protein SM14VA4_49280 [Serratia marcescens]